MKTRSANPNRRAKNWKTFAASHWTFAGKAMGEMKILARLARQLNPDLDEFSTSHWQRLKPGST